MNPLTQVKNTQKISAREADAGVSDVASWHADYKDSAYVFAGGIPYELTEGDLLAVFAQYGEVVDVNLIRDSGTGKSKGFAFLAYEDQRSTTLAVDNLNGAKVCGRTVRVDHVGNYRRKKEEDEEERQKKREENGVCYDFQRGHCSRGDSCKYSHDEKRNADTGWGAEENAKWKNDQFQQRDGRKPSEPRPEFKRPSDREDRKIPRDRDQEAREDEGRDAQRAYSRRADDPHGRDNGRRKPDEDNERKPLQDEDYRRRDGMKEDDGRRSSSSRKEDLREDDRPSRRDEPREDHRRSSSSRKEERPSRRDEPRGEDRRDRHRGDHSRR